MGKPTESVEPTGPPNPWPVRRIILWWILMNLAIYLQGPSYLRAFRPDFFPPGYPLFLPDFFQEWASARNFLEGLPVYTSQEVTLERYIGIKRKPEDPRFIEYNAHPPTTVLLALPLAKLEFAHAFLIWNLVSLLALGLGSWLIVRHLNTPFTYWCLLPTITLLL